MLVIAHNNYIVGYNSLLSAVIETIIRGRNIIVYRQHEALLPAGHGKLSDKLYIVYPGLLLQTLKIEIDSVKAVCIGFIHQAVNQLFPDGGFGQQFLRLNILCNFTAEIIDYRPDLKSHRMSLLHVASASQGFIIPFIITQCKPGRGNNIHTFRCGNQFLHCIVSGINRHLMPDHIDFFVQ